MGMFDYFDLDVNLLPVEENIREKMKESDFQTKDFDCTCNRIYLTKEGELARYVFTKERLAYLRSVGEAFADIGVPDAEDAEYEKIPYHGFVRFYDIVDGEWFEFMAKFTDSKLVEIKLSERYMLNSTPTVQESDTTEDDK